MEDIKISVTKFESKIRHTSNHIYFGILKRRFWEKKYTVAEWFTILDELKKEPA